LSDLFSITTSALQSLQTAIEVTSNNIANANTPGYAVESVQFSNLVPQADGNLPIGAGVDVAGISRAVNQVTNNQLNSSQSTLGQLNSLQTYTNQIDNIVGTTAGGLTTALQNYYSAWSTLATDPTSNASRQALIGAAQAVASSFQTTNTQLQGLNTSINGGISSDVNQINSLATSIATLNHQIVTSAAAAGGQTPNTLLDQRDADVSSLSQLVGITTTTNSDGSLNVYVGNGQPLVLQQSTNQLTTVPNPFNAAQLEISSSTSGGNSISSEISGGDLGGLLAARTQAVDPTLNQVGQIAVGLAQTANAQQNAGLDLNGQFGANLFSVGTPQAIASSNNTGTASATVGITNVGALTANNYVLSYAGGAYSLTNASTGAAVAFTGTGTAASPITADGLSITLSGTPASGDQFLIQPTASAAGSFGVSLTNPSQLAAAGAIQTSASDSNTGSATIGSGTVTNAADPNLLATTTIQFTSPTTYSVNGAGSFAYTSGSNISLNGWQVAISGAPATGDTFTVQSNAGNTGDNRNALASAAQQNLGVLSNGTISINGATSGLVTAVGSQAQQVNTSQTAQAAVNSQALANVQSVSGVNLNEEAANLVQWQQAYQASAQAFQIGNSTFTTFMQAIASG
jgi:flagellar hook-associated protein 1 FlgK